MTGSVIPDSVEYSSSGEINNYNRSPASGMPRFYESRMPIEMFRRTNHWSDSTKFETKCAVSRFLFSVNRVMVQ
jgi:hypothetical protein